MKFLEVPRIPPRDAYRAWRAGRAILVDVRSRSKFERERERIPAALRVDPRALRENPDLLPRDRELVLFCS